MAGIEDAKQQLIDLTAGHTGDHSLSEGEDRHQQYGPAEFARGFKLLIEAQKTAEDAGLSTGTTSDQVDGVEFMC